MESNEITNGVNVEIEKRQLLNQIEQLGAQLQRLTEGMRCYPVTNPMTGPDTQRVTLDQRFVSLGVTELQTGLMHLRRAVEQPRAF